jgi:hypothetical protein
LARADCFFIACRTTVAAAATRWRALVLDDLTTAFLVSASAVLFNVYLVLDQLDWDAN